MDHVYESYSCYEEHATSGILDNFAPQNRVDNLMDSFTAHRLSTLYPQGFFFITNLNNSQIDVLVSSKNQTTLSRWSKVNNLSLLVLLQKTCPCFHSAKQSGHQTASIFRCAVPQIHRKHHRHTDAHKADVFAWRLFCDIEKSPVRWNSVYSQSMTSYSLRKGSPFLYREGRNCVKNYPCLLPWRVVRLWWRFEAISTAAGPVFLPVFPATPSWRKLSLTAPSRNTMMPFWRWRTAYP